MPTLPTLILVFGSLTRLPSPTPATPLGATAVFKYLWSYL